MIEDFEDWSDEDYKEFWKGIIEEYLKDTMYEYKIKKWFHPFTEKRGRKNDSD